MTGNYRDDGDAFTEVEAADRPRLTRFYAAGAEADVRRNCIRCGISVHRNTEGPHLCRDVAGRLRNFVTAERDAEFEWYRRNFLLDLGGEA